MSNPYKNWDAHLSVSDLDVGVTVDHTGECNIGDEFYDPLTGKVESSSITDSTGGDGLDLLKDFDELDSEISELIGDVDFFGDEVSDSKINNYEPQYSNNSNTVDSQKTLSDVSKESLLGMQDDLTNNSETIKSNADSDKTKHTTSQTKKISENKNDVDQVDKYLILTKKVLLFGVLPLIGLFTIILMVGSRPKDKSVPVQQQTQVVQEIKTPTLDNILIMNEQFTGLSDYVEDLLIVEKKSIVTGDSLVTFVCGKTTKNNVYLSVPVSTETYNRLVNGSIIKVRFKQLKINNIIYNTDIELGGVIG